MGMQVLVMFPLKDGEMLIDALEANGFPIAAALWIYNAEEDEWQLMIGSPQYDEAGPLAVYTEVQSALSTLPEPRDLSIDDVTVLSVNNRIVTDLKNKVTVTKGEPIKRLKNLYLGDLDVKEAIVYRSV